MARSTGLIYDERMSSYSCPWDPDYVEHPGRFTCILERLKELELLFDKGVEVPLSRRYELLQPRTATEEELRTVHSERLVEFLKATEGEKDEEKLKNQSSKYDCVYLHPDVYPCALLSAGCALTLTDAVCDPENDIRNGFGLLRPPGHHAGKDEICGYCYFNNAALAARRALHDWNMQRVLIVDWDVHHGQATQREFYGDKRVLYFSIHRYEFGEYWPSLRESDFDHVGEGEGKGFNVNVPVNELGNTDADYMAIFLQVLMPMAVEFDPELVIISAGFDAAVGCPEGEQMVTPACYAHFTHLISALAGGRVVALLEGGYFLPSLAEAAALTFRALLGDPCPRLLVWDEHKSAVTRSKLGEPRDSMKNAIGNVRRVLRPFWKCFQVGPTDSAIKEVIWRGPPLDQAPPTEFDPMCPTDKRPDEVEERFEKIVANLIGEHVKSGEYELPMQRLHFHCQSRPSGEAMHAFKWMTRRAEFTWSAKLGPNLAEMEEKPRDLSVSEALAGVGQFCQASLVLVDSLDLASKEAGEEITFPGRRRKTLAINVHRVAGKYCLFPEEEGNEMLEIDIGLHDEDEKRPDDDSRKIRLNFARPPSEDAATTPLVPDSALEAALFRVILPIAYEFAPDLVALVLPRTATRLLSTRALSLLGHHLAATGRLLALVEDGEDVPQTTALVESLAETLLTKTVATPRPPLQWRNEPHLEELRERLAKTWSSLRV